ncbi:MAG TPA: DsbA family oxidoreductase [Nocardioidaceae bacterium]|nr:DsbA family oxidoreductase [Nocardioidaceae bacterium]
MKVEIWSDVVCPWCHIGKRRFETALGQFAQREEVEVEWKSFELDPGAESVTDSTSGDDSADDTDYRDRLARKYGTTPDSAQQMLDSMTAAAAAEGLDFHFERARASNTFDAHQVIHLAGERGVQDAVKERLLRAYFSEGEAVGDRGVLARLAAEAGLDAAEVSQALDEQWYAAAVRADEQEAVSLGASGVPFFVIDRRYGVSGAQPAEQFLQVLQQAWAERNPLTMVGASPDGDVCGPDGCST